MGLLEEVQEETASPKGWPTGFGSCFRMVGNECVPFSLIQIPSFSSSLYGHSALRVARRFGMGRSLKNGK
jgi:hypothetical protein